VRLWEVGGLQLRGFRSSWWVGWLICSHCTLGEGELGDRSFFEGWRSIVSSCGVGGVIRQRLLERRIHQYDFSLGSRFLVEANDTRIILKQPI
jgi:hypothetical protein